MVSPVIWRCVCHGLPPLPGGSATSIAKEWAAREWWTGSGKEQELVQQMSSPCFLLLAKYITTSRNSIVLTAQGTTVQLVMPLIIWPTTLLDSANEISMKCGVHKWVTSCAEWSHGKSHGKRVSILGFVNQPSMDCRSDYAGVPIRDVNHIVVGQACHEGAMAATIIGNLH